MPSLKNMFSLSEALAIIRGQKVLKVKKLDDTKNPEAQKFVAVKAAEHVPGGENIVKRRQESCRKRRRIRHLLY